jgi:hypothetical protein
MMQVCSSVVNLRMLKIFVCFSLFFFQTIITMINQAIGASGVVSQQCKAVVSQYGEAIMDLLLSQVKTSFTFISVFSINHG